MTKKLFSVIVMTCVLVGFASVLLALPKQSGLSVPEPAIMFFFGAILMGVAGYGKKRNKK